MNFVFDKTEPRLTIDGFPLGTSKVKLSIPEFVMEQNVASELEIGNFSLNLNATLTAIKVEEVTTEIPLLDVSGEQMSIGGVLQFTDKVETVETILGTKVIDLKVL